jgi:glycine oxidase
MPKAADAVVVGGGVVGSAVAWMLAREGLAVTLLERDAIAAHASGAAAGMLTPSPEASDDGPFLRFARASLALFPGWCEAVREGSGVDPEFEASGSLHVARTPDESERIRERATRLATPGAEWLDARAAREAAPGLAEAITGALWSPDDAHVRSPLFTRACATAAEQLRARVETGVAAVGLRRTGTRITGVLTTAGERAAGCVVLCTGAWLRECIAWLGARVALPIEPVRGQILSLAAPLPPLRTIVFGGGVYLVPKRDHSVVVGATQERVGFDCRVTAEGVAQLLAAAPGLVPALSRSTFGFAWAGLRPETPDHLPLVGTLPGVEGLVIAAGHFRNGVLLAPITAQLVADLVRGKALPADAEALRPERFSD